jgi:hypothetical protein
VSAVVVNTSEYSLAFQVSVHYNSRHSLYLLLAMTPQQSTTRIRYTITRDTRIYHKGTEGIN